VVPLLASAGHRVLAPSLTGYGDKAHLLGPEVGLDTHVDDIVGLIVEEDLTEVVLVGHSYAGLVISSAANQVPDRIGGLVYLDAMVPEDGESAADVLPVTQALIDLAAKSDSGWRVPPLPELPPPVGPVRGHRPGGRRLAADDALGPAGALPPATGPARQPGRERDPPDPHPLHRRQAGRLRPAPRPRDAAQRRTGTGVGTGDRPRLHGHHAGRALPNYCSSSAARANGVPSGARDSVRPSV
jgi:pimeloyl-ACP methyl ester carboxylesterase